METNPNHPVTTALREQWHTICALLLWKHGPGLGALITSDDIDAFHRAYPNGAAVVVDGRGDELHLDLVDAERAKKLALTAGGLPV